MFYKWVRLFFCATKYLNNRCVQSLPVTIVRKSNRELIHSRHGTLTRKAHMVVDFWQCKKANITHFWNHLDEVRIKRLKAFLNHDRHIIAKHFSGKRRLQTALHWKNRFPRRIALTDIILLCVLFRHAEHNEGYEIVDAEWLVWSATLNN